MSLRIGPPPQHKPQFKPPGTQSAATSGELFDQLEEVSWTPATTDVPIYFPVLDFKTTVSQTVVPHKYWAVDGARVESTGREPAEFEATIPFFNGIFPAAAEQWVAGTLYPDVFRALFGAFDADKAGTLNHPELGPIFCRWVSFDFSHNANTRDGVEVTARWIESREDVTQDRKLLSSLPSPISQAQIASSTLDAGSEDLVSLVPEAAVTDESLSSIVGKVTAGIDAANAETTALATSPLQLLTLARKVVDAIDRTKGTKNALAWQYKLAAQQLEESAHDLGRTETKTVYDTGGNRTIVSAASPGKHIIQYEVDTRNLTATLLLARLRMLGSNTSIEEFRELNPALMSAPTIPLGAMARFYV